MGPRSLISLFDIKDAYKNCKIRPEDLWQQVYRVGTASLSTLGNVWITECGGFLEFSDGIYHFMFKVPLFLPELRYFVDNGVNITQAIDGKEDFTKANADFDALILFIRQAGVPFHDTHKPSTSARFLG